MSILKRSFKVIDTHERVQSDFRKSFTTKVEQLDQIQEGESPWREIYEYKALLRVRFTANLAEYDRALENAKMQMQDYMYSEVLLALREMQSCVYNGDARATLQEIDRLRTLIMEID